MSLRVFELAKELNIPTRDLIKRIGKLDIKIKGNFSSLNEEQIIIIKKDFLEPATRIKETIVPAAEGVKKVRRRIISAKKAVKAQKIQKSLEIADTTQDSKADLEAEQPPKTKKEIKDVKEDAKSETVKIQKESKKNIKAKAPEKEKKKEEKEVKTTTAAEKEKKKEEKEVKTTTVAEKEKKKEEKEVKTTTAAEKEKIAKKTAEAKPKKAKTQEKKPAGNNKVQNLSAASSKKKFKKGKRNEKPGQTPSHLRQTKYSGKHRLSKAAARRERYKKQDNKKPKHTFNPRQKDLVTGEFITVGELSSLIGIKVPEIIKHLMSLGIMAAITQSIDGETAALVASEYGINLKVEYTSIEDSIEQFDDDDDEEQLDRRPPVVTIMGHVDHGKTSLLDKIRKSNIIDGEAGGITQHIGAYHVKTAEGKITFLDTPGHEAFTEMRARGANITDIVILVVAADDGPRPQTIEAINHSKAAGVEMVVALNKCDKPEANPERTIQDLMRHDVIPEELGGTAPIIQISAKTGEGIDKLLEMVHLQAEMMELKTKAQGSAQGVVIESRVDMKRGNIASILIRSGILKVGDPYVVGSEYGRVRAMWNDQGKKISAAYPSEPVEIAGLSGMPKAGDPFNVGKDEKQVRQIATLRGEKDKEKRQAKQKRVTLENLFDKVGKNEKRILNLIVKTDVIGSVEALTESLKKLGNEKVSVNIVHNAVGAIIASDVLLASTSDAIIIGFNTRPDKSAKKMSQDENVDIRLYSVIYEAIEDVKQALEGMLEPVMREEIQGKAEVLQVFNIPKIGVVAGSKVTNGKILRDCSVRVIRDNVIIHNGKLSSLRRFKDSAKEVTIGYECGIAVESFKDIRVGDELESYLRLSTPAKL